MMPTDDLAAIAHLDFNDTEVQCQCENELCTAHGGCKNTATRYVEFHAIGDCETKRHQLNPFGNYVVLLCSQCRDTLTQVVAEYLAKLNRHGRAICSECGCLLAEPTPDVIREDNPIR